MECSFVFDHTFLKKNTNYIFWFEKKEILFINNSDKSFFVFSTKIATEIMELLPSQYFISRNLTFRCATKFKSKIIVCMAGWRFSCNFSISYVIVLFCNKVETKGEETIFNLKLLLGCPATKEWNTFWNRILIFLSTSIFIHTEKFITNCLVDLE